MVNYFLPETGTILFFAIFMIYQNIQKLHRTLQKTEIIPTEKTKLY
jgi:hypothetical protein